MDSRELDRYTEATSKYNLPNNPTLDFFEALHAVIAGHKITKAEWGNDEYYGVLRDGLLMLHKPDGFHTWIISEADMLGTDWQIFN